MSTVAAHPFLAVFAAIAVVCVIGLAGYFWFTRDKGGHKAPGPWTRSAARATRAARRALDTTRRLPGATRTWLAREVDGLTDYTPDEVYHWAAVELHHDEYPIDRPRPGTPPLAPAPVGGESATAERAAGGAHPAGGPGPPAAGTLTPAAGDLGPPGQADTLHRTPDTPRAAGMASARGALPPGPGTPPMPLPRDRALWGHWHTELIPAIDVPAAKDAAAALPPMSPKLAQWIADAEEAERAAAATADWDQLAGTTHWPLRDMLRDSFTMPAIRDGA